MGAICCTEYHAAQQMAELDQNPVDRGGSPSGSPPGPAL